MDVTGITFENANRTVSYDVSPERAKAVMDRLVAFLAKNEIHCGDTVMQRDGAQEVILDFMADLIDDVIQPQVTFHNRKGTFYRNGAWQ